MKKSKFLLLGTLSSLAAIPFVAAKCGEPKAQEEKKPEADKKPGEGKEPGQNTDQGKNPETDTTPAKSTKIDLSKLETNIQNELKKLAKKDVLSEDVIDVLKKIKGLESVRLGDLSKVEFNETDKKLTIEAHKDSKLITGKYEFTAQSKTDTTPAKSTKIDLSKLETNIQNELKKLAKKDVLSEDVIDVLKKIKGLESVRLGDLSKVEFNETDKKLTIEAHKDSKLITGKYSHGEQK
ncbi:variable surface lipoprotein [Mycoplasmopsis agalactiae]|uniref:variable surface lipoprotein n=1 Tax=Mycoplasmopsis agalactiae TaxID=2110 RepID=UPI00211BB874|nr:variable surface lipoprotein [Mycoplasmopsis agalactiae]UUM25488.1 variable surface lipoprotein [Mycoplasmopsis agalactiae]